MGVSTYYLKKPKNWRYLSLDSWKR